MMAENRMTVFGATVWELMARRGVRQWLELSRKLSEHGYDFKPARISNWVYGKHAVDRSFGWALADVLELNEEERTLLAKAFLFGQGTTPYVQHEKRLLEMARMLRHISDTKRLDDMTMADVERELNRIADALESGKNYTAPQLEKICVPERPEYGDLPDYEEGSPEDHCLKSGY